MKWMTKILTALILQFPALAYSKECSFVSIDSLAEKGVKVTRRLFESSNEVEVNFSLPVPEKNQHENVVRLWVVQEGKKIIDVPLGKFGTYMSLEVYQFSMNSKLITQANISIAYNNSKNQRESYCVRLT